MLEIAGHEHFVRGRGYLKSKADLATVVIGVVITEDGMVQQFAQLTLDLLGVMLQIQMKRISIDTQTGTGLL